MIDVIFLSYTKNLHYYGLTQRSINTLIQNNKDVDFNIFVGDYPLKNLRSDVNKDGQVNVFDFNLMISNFGK